METPTQQRLPSAVRDRTLAVLKLAEELGAGTTVLTSSDVAVELVRQADTLNCATLVTGRPSARRGPALWRIRRPTVTRQLATLAPALDIVEIGLADSTRRLPQAVPRNDREDEETVPWREAVSYTHLTLPTNREV